jgi:hypothetical protein
MAEQSGFLRDVADGGVGLGPLVTSPSAPVGRPLLSAPFELSSTGTVVAAVPGASICVYAAKVNAIQASAVAWASGSTPLEGAQSYVQYGGYVESVEYPYSLFKTAPGEALRLIVTGQVAGRVSYWED